MKVWMRLHKWIGLVIGLQVLLWIAGGLYMSAMPLTWVHGKPLLNEAAMPEPPEQLLMRSLQTPNNVEWNLSEYRVTRWLHGPQGWLLVATGFDNTTQFWRIDRNGKRLAEPLSDTLLQQEAMARYAGDAGSCGGNDGRCGNCGCAVDLNAPCLCVGSVAPGCC